MDNNVFDGFSITLFQDDDGDWMAHFAEMPNVSAFSDTPDQALVELKEAWEGIKESYRENGEAIPLAPEIKSMSST